MRLAATFARRLGRVLLLMLLVAVGTVLLVRYAPGYFSELGSLDPKYSQTALHRMEMERQGNASFFATAKTVFGGWAHGDLGQSRQYEVSAGELVKPRIAVTLSLLVRAILAGWLLASAAALPLSALRNGAALLSAPFTLLLAVPTGAMATLALLSGLGGPVLVLSLILAARDFKFLYRLFRTSWTAPHLLHARAQGLRLHRLVLRGILPSAAPQLLSLMTLSFVTALSAVVPVEVIFGVPGLGQLAWSAAMNRDLPVLLAVTLLMALAVACAGIFSEPLRTPETA